MCVGLMFECVMVGTRSYSFSTFSTDVLEERGEVALW